MVPGIMRSSFSLYVNNGSQSSLFQLGIKIFKKSLDVVCIIVYICVCKGRECSRNKKRLVRTMKHFVFMGVDFNELKSANFVPFYHVAYLEFKNGSCIRKDFDNLQQMVNFEEQVKYQGIENWRGLFKNK